MKETYGDATSDSSDEDYGGTNSPKRHKNGRGKAMQMFTDEIESRSMSTDTADENQNENEDDHHKLDVSQRSSTGAGPSGKNASRSYKRLGEAVTQVFPHLISIISPESHCCISDERRLILSYCGCRNFLKPLGKISTLNRQ